MRVPKLINPECNERVGTVALLLDTPGMLCRIAERGSENSAETGRLQATCRLGTASGDPGHGGFFSL